MHRLFLDCARTIQAVHERYYRLYTIPNTCYNTLIGTTLRVSCISSKSITKHPNPALQSLENPNMKTVVLHGSFSGYALCFDSEVLTSLPALCKRIFIVCHEQYRHLRSLGYRACSQKVGKSRCKRLSSQDEVEALQRDCLQCWQYWEEVMLYNWSSPKGSLSPSSMINMIVATMNQTTAQPLV